jgi:hypothetical protein
VFSTPLSLKKILAFSVKDRYQLNYFICIKDFNAETNTSLKLNLFSFFIYGCQHYQRKTICLYVYISDIRQIVGKKNTHINLVRKEKSIQYGCFESCQFRSRSVFFLSWRLNKSAGDFRCLRYYCDNVSIS